MGKKLVTAQKRGETRALCLGVAMVVSAAITYYVLGTTLLPLHLHSVWTQKSTCHLIETHVHDEEELEGRTVPRYPCLWVNVSVAGEWAVLYHTEDTRGQNRQCSYIPEGRDSYRAAREKVEEAQRRFREHRAFPCFVEPGGTAREVLFRRRYGPRALLEALLWPSCLLTGGLLVIAMVKLNQYLSALAAQK
ncbi:calcium-activated potassium channel subunit beta-1 [Sorex araneus]|uniref:calcium-activated potassium channel subunit beta-1 n=1 Tax=Sorex araneus TaxID=42254 RepID=UPI002433DEC8|nr:calcium-activated potassium channel subunit beta-1 [Sorex araneus]